MAACNVPSRTIFTGDNLDILRGINSECVDLIYLDPPFNSNRTYAAPLDSEARGAEFDDVWTLSDMKQEWLGEIELRRPALFHLINSAKLAHGESMAGYLTFMSVRLIELHRILKPNGSIYLHCDPHASHYLKVLLDALFGEQSYKAEITWRRTSAHNDSLSFGNVRDIILFYGPRARINTGNIRAPLDPEYVERFYRFSDERGLYQLGDLTAPRKGTGETGQIWRGHDPNETGRQWNAPKSGAYAAWIEANIIRNYRSIRSPLARLEALDAAGLIQHTTDGVPRLKRYLAGNRGQVPSNLWADIRPISANSRERTGWRTQKPLALLERVINASSRPGDLVLDPFCGCATACIAAEKLGRDWIGIDRLHQAVGVLRGRAERELQIPMTEAGERAWQDWSIFTQQNRPPKRTDSPLDLLSGGEASAVRRFLYTKQQGRCAGCEHEIPLHVLTVDHINPRSRGGSDDISNLQLMDSTCNAIKGDRDMAYLRQRLRELGILRNGG